MSPYRINASLEDSCCAQRDMLAFRQKGRPGPKIGLDVARLIEYPSDQAFELLRVSISRAKVNINSRLVVGWEQRLSIFILFANNCDELLLSLIFIYFS